MKFKNIGKKIKVKDIKRSSRAIKSIAVHCLYTPMDMDVGAKDVHSWHRERGWSGCGYHFIILLDGSIEIGRDIDYVGSHVRHHNRDTIGIAYAGGGKRVGKKIKPVYDEETPEQRESLIKLSHHLAKIHGLKTSKIKGHNEYPNVHKTCPNLTMSLIRSGTPIIKKMRSVADGESISLLPRYRYMKKKPKGKNKENGEALQRLLNQGGAKLKVDGWTSRKTDDAVKSQFWFELKR